MKKLITNQDQQFSKKEQKAKLNQESLSLSKPPPGPNINSISKKHLPIITDNLNLVEMFPKDSIFCAYKKFPDFKVVIVRADPYSIKPLKQVHQDPGCNDCKKRGCSCRNLLTIYHLLNVLKQEKF